MTIALTRKQPALGAEPAAALSLEWRHRGDPAALWRVLQGMSMPQVVIGIGAPLAHAVGVRVPGLEPFARLQRGRFTMPATQHDLWALVPGPDAGRVFEGADPLQAALAPVAQVVSSTSLFNYRQGRDLTGYQDGTENPKDDDAWAAALVPEGPLAGGSFALVQGYLHFRARFASMGPAACDDVVGRRLVDDVEIPEAPETAHVKRTAQEDFDPPAFMLRRSMPWGGPRRHGLQFIAFVHDLDVARRQLQRMMGLDDGRQDALLSHTQAESGAFYWCPPWDGTRRQLADATVDAAPAAPRPAAALPRVQLVEDGPLQCEGALDIDGVPATQVRLCRCGHSARKPYCDESHRAHGFRASGEVPPIDEPQAEVAPVRTRVQAVADGPLLLWGAVELAGASGRTITRCVGPTLCRCGQSAHKPFCDGSHAAAGFRAPD